LTLALRPNDEKDAWPRLATLVERLGQARSAEANGTADDSSAPDQAGTNLATLLNWQPPANGTIAGVSPQPPDLRASCARVERCRMRFDLVLQQV
jgi:hypothetical protein